MVSQGPKISGGIPRAASDSTGEISSGPLIFFNRPLPDYCITDFEAPEAVRTQFDDLKFLDQNADDFTAQIGYFGEKMGYLAFSENTQGEVVWLNQISERGRPYDLVHTSPSGVKTYIEVKTTLSSQKEYFILSEAEWEFANTQEQNFCILRVYNIADPEMVHMTLVRNPALLWKHN